jgi:transcriptional regulator with XRE-family HTH domain
LEFASISGVNRGSPAREPGHLSAESEAIVVARLQYLLTRQGISARELARRADLPQSTVNDALRGRGGLKLGVMVHLVEGFGLRSIEELIAPFGTSQLRRSEFRNDTTV